MFETVSLERWDGGIAGYHFPCDEARAVMVLIHGIGEHTGRYVRMADYLGARGIAVVAMDLRGHGHSGGVRGDTAPRAEILGDVDALLDWAAARYPGLPITLYGHSMGGNICLDYRARGARNGLPDRYIVSGPWIKLVMSIPGPLYVAVKLLAKVAPRLAIRQSFPEEDLGNLDYVRPYRDDPLVHGQITLRCAVDCFDIGNAVYAGKHPDNGGAAGKPFLLMHGGADRICHVEGSRQLARQLAGTPGFTYIEWPDYCHEIHNGGPTATGEEVLAAIARFVRAEEA